MKNLFFTLFVVAMISTGCNKESEPAEEPARQNEPSISNRWRLIGTLPDTATQFYWVTVSYQKTNSYPTEYYCVPTPNISPYFGKNYFSPYKCTVVENNIYYVLPDANCNKNLTPFIIDTPWSQNLKNDMLFNADSSFRYEYGYEQSKWIKWFTSTCSSVQYFQAVKKDYGYSGNWSFNPATNIISIDYKATFGYTTNANYDVINFTDNGLPRTEKWKVQNLNDSTVILNSCITCDVNSGFRRLYRKQ